MSDEAWLEDDQNLDSRDVQKELDSEWSARKQSFYNTGYRDGLEDGKQQTLQQGFDEGYARGIQAGLCWGRAKGGLTDMRHLEDRGILSSTLNTDDKEAAIVLGTPNKDFQDVMCKLILADLDVSHKIQNQEGAGLETATSILHAQNIVLKRLEDMWQDSGTHQ